MASNLPDVWIVCREGGCVPAKVSGPRFSDGKFVAVAPMKSLVNETVIGLRVRVNDRYSIGVLADKPVPVDRICGDWDEVMVEFGLTDHGVPEDVPGWLV